ncbi:MAG: hypothetical protein MUE67_09625 [Anaerolineales bacterium]|nr:hypothetical protein [Anaerolineales bacterium]
MTSRLTKPINRVAAFAPYTWKHPVSMLRIVRPFEAAGIQLVPGVQDGIVHPEAALQADAVLIQREFPGYSKGTLNRILAIARQAGKPVIYDTDDLLFDLPQPVDIMRLRARQCCG